MSRDYASSLIHRASPFRVHLRTLEELHKSLFAPRFRALESYGEPPPPPPTLEDVAAAAAASLAWHEMKEAEVAAELASRRAANGNSALIDDAARTLAYHRAERERISAGLSAVNKAVPALQAAE